MSAGTQVTKEVDSHKSTIKELIFPSLAGVAAGTYNVAFVVASNGEVSVRLTEPISDATLSTISTLTVKDGIITAKA